MMHFYSHTDKLTQWGLTPEIQSDVLSKLQEDWEIGRIVEQHKESYQVVTTLGIIRGEITGKMRFASSSAEDFPVVGDWVFLSVMDEDMAIIHEIAYRNHVLKRKSVKSDSQVQLIATNVDMACIIQGLDDNFNVNRLSRYLAVVFEAGIEPCILLSKSDLLAEADWQSKMKQVTDQFGDIPVISYSSPTQQGIDKIWEILEIGKTYCFIGSSGVGKSTLLNLLMHNEQQQTKEISQSTGKGMHTTTSRSLFMLQNGSLCIDTPGMRELGMTDDQQGIKDAYRFIAELEADCKFADCKHTSEPGCRVLEALENDEITYKSFENYQKLQREAQRFTTNKREKHLKDKQQGKFFKQVKAQRKKDKF